MIPHTQLRLLLFTTLLLGTTVVLNTERAETAAADRVDVFREPPAYLHPPDVLRFDLSGLKAPSQNRTEAELLLAAEKADDFTTRAQAHLELAIYYKMQGREEAAREERRKAEYWRRLVEHVPADTEAP